MFFLMEWGGTQVRPTHWRDYISQKAWEHLGVSPPETLEVVGEEREVWASPAQIGAQ